MNKRELIDILIKAENENKAAVELRVHMPTGDIETIINPNIKSKREYIERAYDDELRLKTCPDIFIVEAKIIENNKMLSFSQAFEEVKKGKGMRLPHWKPDVIIRVQYPDEHSKMTAPYLYVESRFGCVPWKETMIELFADDWEVVE